MRPHQKQPEGEWVKAKNGGKWFRPVGWKPKRHFAIGEGILCGGRSVSLRTDNPDNVDCGSCLLQLRIRNFRLIMYLVAALIWARTQPKEAKEAKEAEEEKHAAV